MLIDLSFYTFDIWSFKIYIYIDHIMLIFRLYIDNFIYPYPQIGVFGLLI